MTHWKFYINGKGKWLAATGALLLSVGMTAANNNLATGKVYTVSPAPSYRHCTDPGDTIQLTDGDTTSAYFWTQQGTVGWQRPAYVTITVDLGRVEPIGGAALTTAAGTAGVTWPMAVYTLVSDDGLTYREAGELVAPHIQEAGPWPDGYGIRLVQSNSLKTAGRFVQFVIIPLAAAPYFFTDEMYVYRGDESFTSIPRSGPAVTARQLYEEGRLQRAAAKRLGDDAAFIRKSIVDAEGPAVLLDALDAVDLRPHNLTKTASNFRTEPPYNRAHAELFRIQAACWKALGRSDLSVSVPPAWDPVDPYALPPENSEGAITVHTMRGEERTAAVNLFNATDAGSSIHVRFSGIPGSPAPEYISVSIVKWTDTVRAQPIAAALVGATRDRTGWEAQVPPGLVRQIWLTVKPANLDPGTYTGHVELNNERLPIRIRVWPFDFPEETSLLVGGWSYTNGKSRYGVNEHNKEAFLRHLQDRFVNAPWATSSTMRQFTWDPVDPEKIILDTQEFDDWIDDWPDARRYLVFLSIAHYGGSIKTRFGGASIDSPEFNHKVGIWISAWVEHLRSRGIEPGRLGLLLHDEPHEGSDVSAFLAWARAIKAAEPDVLIWEDPTYIKPAEAPAELFEMCDVLCPNRPSWLQRDASFAPFFGRMREQGKELQLYSCSGPVKLLDPYSYYRLQAWHAWQIGATGSFFWAFGDNSGASSWNEYYAKAGPYTPLFLDDRTVIPGKHMEAIRESVQDFEYLVMLRDAIAKANPADPLVAQAKTLLREEVDAVLGDPGAGKLNWHDPKDRSLADQARVKMLELLLRFKGDA